MKNLFIAFLLVFTTAGGGYSQSDSVDAPSVTVETPVAPKPFSRTLRVPLPYSFVRSGVQVQVNSVELANDGLLVNLSLDETQGQPVEVPLRTMMEARTLRGRLLPYTGYDK